MGLRQPPAPKPRPGFPVSLPGRGPVTGHPTSARALAPTPSQTRPAGSAKSALPVPQGHGLDSEAVRQAMVHKLVAQGGVDPRVAAAMARVERHRFVDSGLANQAYEDTSLPIGLGQTISKPSVVARMLSLALEGRPDRLGRVLEIGTGCGYQAALLSHLAQAVYSVERLRGLHDKARDNLRHLRLANLHLLLGDGMLGYPAGGPYGTIVSAAGGASLPTAWLDQLAVGGRLVAPSAQADGRQSLLVVDKAPTGCVQRTLEAVHFVPLKSGVI